MDTQLFALNEYCSIHRLDPTFIHSLEEEGLIIVIERENTKYIEEEQLQQLEIFTRWHVDMGVNPQGIDAMNHLLEKLRALKEELNDLKHRLRLYEPGNII